jgi:hypothetical protein
MAESSKHVITLVDKIPISVRVLHTDEVINPVALFLNFWVRVLRIYIKF